jgi:hypothetical protein
LEKSANLFVVVEFSPDPDRFVMLLLPFELPEVIRIVACFRHSQTTSHVYDIATYTEDVREQAALAIYLL